MSRRAIAGNPQRLEPPQHLSHSSRETLLRCAKSWFLRYRTPAPRRPALWSVGGSAVHETTELWDRETISDREVPAAWADRFEFHLQKAFAADPNEWNWGRSKTEPIEIWRGQGLDFVNSYVAWRKRSPYTIWTTPDGTPAIELDVSGFLPGCPVEVKGFVDRIFVDSMFDKLIDVDLKSGKRPPKNGDQFGTYAALTEVKYGIRTDLGVPFLTRKATLGKPYDLAAYTPEAVGQAFADAWELIQGGIFPATGIATNDCFICDLASSCAAKGGPLAARYDPSHPDYEFPPF